MPRSPSPDLARWLLDHQLCTPRDLTRCGKRVAKLVDDLPPFDFVWLDALVQLGRLSPYQAQILESPEPDQLLLGHCLLVHPCSSGTGNQTWNARHTATGARVAIKLIRGSGSEQHSAAAWQRLAQSLRGLRAPGICGPIEALPTQRGLVLLSPWVDGPHLRELVVRSGRFPPAVVATIGWQLLTSLQLLESLGLQHGDLRLENVRLTPGGQIVLVDTGVRPILEPEQTVHSGMDPDHFEGIAPERIGTAQPATPAAELYAVGCLLWHLLVGRPPFPAGDPVVKLSRHQSRDVDDVREHAPETPASLAEVLLALTRRDPSQRPAGAAAALRQWPRQLPDSQRVLKTFLQEVEQPAALPRSRQTHRRLSLAVWGTLGLAVFAGAGFFASRAGFETPLRGPRAERNENRSAEELAGGGSEDAARGDLVAASKPSAERDDAGHASEPGTAPPDGEVRLASHVDNDGTSAMRSRTARPLPAPDAAGVLSLTGDQLYELRDISVVGGLIIRGDEGAPARIRIGEPGEITAQSIVIRNVIFEIAPGGLTEPGETGAALTLRTQRAELVSVGCWGADLARPNAVRPALVRWELVDERDVRNSNLRLSHCVFRHGGAAVVIPQVVARVEVRESLFEECEVALELAGSAKRSIPLAVRWNHVTTRGLQNVIRWWGEEGPPGGIRLEWELQDSVLHLADPGGALVQLLSARYTNDWIPRLGIGGAGNLLAPEQTIVRWQSDSTGESLEIDSPELEVEGLMSVPFEFAAARGAALQPLGRIPGVALRRTRPPGCDPARLPGEAGGQAEPPAP